MKRISIYIIVMTLVSLGTAFAQSDSPGVGFKSVSQSSMNFLQVGVVPKAIALGDAYTAIGQGVESIFYNPAGLAESDQKYELFFSMTRWIADIDFLAAAVSYNLGNAGTLGLSFISVDYGDIIGTSLISATDIATDEQGYKDTGIVSNVGAYSFGVAYSRRITDAFLFGGGLRLVGQQLGQSMLANGMTDNNATNFAFDLGVKYYTPIRSFRFGMSIRNFGNSVKYEEITSSLPVTFAVGVAMDMVEIFTGNENNENSLLTSIEFTHPNNYTERLHFGVDYSLKEFFSARAGYITNHDIAGMSLGLSIMPSLMGTNIEMSYSYSMMNSFSDVNRISFKLTL